LVIDFVTILKKASSKGDPVKRISQLTLGTCLAIAALITANAPVHLGI
jgi:hypothetical protein